MNKLSRRGFLKAGGGGVAAGAAVSVGAVVASPEARAAAGAILPYEEKVIGQAGSSRWAGRSPSRTPTTPRPAPS